MTLKSYLWDRRIHLLSDIVLMVFIFLLCILLKAPVDLIIFTLLVIIILKVIVYGYDVYKRCTYYKKICTTLEGLDKKYYLSEMIQKNEFLEAQFLGQILQETSKSMIDELRMYKQEEESYRTYIETWIHEIKGPIAGIDLISKNNPSPVTMSILEELFKIEGYVEQALYYARSGHVSSDYFIQEVSLGQLVKDTLKKHSKVLIKENALIELETLDYAVKTDGKWFKFILGQLMANAIQYKKDTLKLSISATREGDKTILCIEDNGIGILVQDLGRVFDKGFTGSNGRQHSRSTGMGLFLCKRLCKNFI